MLFAVSAALLLLATIAAEEFRSLAQEDAWMEWATFLAFAFAGGTSLHSGLRASRFQVSRGISFCIAGFCFFVAGEEISWGQRILTFSPPEIFLEHNYQQEANVHNFLKGIFDSRWQVFTIAFGYGLIAPLAAAWIRRFPRELAPARELMAWFGAVATLEFVYPFSLAGEFAELLLGLVFIADVCLRRSHALGFGRHLPQALLASALFGALLLEPAVEVLAKGSDPERVQLAVEELRLLEADTQNSLTDRIGTKRRVHKRLFTAVKQRYLKFGQKSSFLGQERLGANRDPIARRDRKRYFLDPWGQPYWLLYDATKSKAGGTVVVYSFGPNRKRDSRVASTGQSFLSGDDLGFVTTIDRTSLQTDHSQAPRIQ